MKPSLSLVALAAIQCIGTSPAWAQTSSTAAPATLATVVVTGNPLGNDAVVAPVEVLSGKDLQNRRAATLGETLNGLPGVASTGFGPNASRPTIRGMDGDRIRILDNSGSMADASSLSDDHAVAIDPLTIERVEVLRGPATLLYGGSALGGVVNVQDNRISAQPLFDAKGGKSAQVDISNGSTPGGHALSALLETGTDRYTLHIDGFDRYSPNVPVREAVCEDANGNNFTSRRICNSASASSGGAVGATLHFDRGHIGLAHSGLKMNYGTVAEPNVTIGLHSDKTRLAGEWQAGVGVLDRIRWQLGSSDYRHTEFDAGAPATTFTQRAHDARIELHHTAVLGHKGLLGYQRDISQFGADGAEAYAPYSRTRKEALFLYEELPTSWGQLQWGGRVEDVRVTSLGNPAVARLNNALGEKTFKPASTSVGALFHLTQGWQATTQLALSQRAPNDAELFANGPHAATKAYEVGNANLGIEKSRSLDLGLTWKSGEHSLRMNAYTNQIRNYIFLQNTGQMVSEEGDPEDPVGSGFTAALDPADLPRYDFTATTARFRGLEFSGTHPLPALTAMTALSAGKWFADWRADLVRADNVSTGQPLPRIAPARLGASLRMERGPVQAQLGFDHSMSQTRVPAGQVATSGYTLWHVRGSVQLRRDSNGQLSAYARLDNLSNVKSFSATSVLTQTAPGKSPLAGRSLTLGLRYGF